MLKAVEKPLFQHVDKVSEGSVTHFKTETLVNQLSSKSKKQNIQEGLIMDKL